MNVAAIHFEVKKHAVRQTADGWVISFVVHPNDMDSTFAVSPLGTRYMLAVAQIGDDEQPIPPAGKPHPTTAEKGAVSEPDTAGPLTKPSTPAGDHKERRPWHTLPPQQRAGMLCSDRGFQKWVMEAAGWPDCGEHEAREWLCQMVGVKSRADIPASEDAWNRYDELEADFMRASGRMPEVW